MDKIDLSKKTGGEFGLSYPIFATKKKLTITYSLWDNYDFMLILNREQFLELFIHLESSIEDFRKKPKQCKKYGRIKKWLI